MEPSTLLSTHAGLLASLPNPPPLLDLACGDGRNGLWLAEKGLQVVFADRSETALQGIARQLQLRGWPGNTWHVDLEEPGARPLAGRQFSAVLVFHYLHRPLFPALAEAVAPGGLVIYQTFTLDNRRFGRPRNPDYLLGPGELRNHFRDWQALHYFEGVRTGPERAVAELVARKPTRRRGKAAAPAVS